MTGGPLRSASSVKWSPVPVDVSVDLALWTLASEGHPAKFQRERTF